MEAKYLRVILSEATEMEKDIINTLFLVDSKIPMISRYNAVCKKYKIKQADIHNLKYKVLKSIRNIYEQHNTKASDR